MSREMKPFVLRYGEPLDVPPAHPFQYDLKRQIGQVCVHGVWIDVVDARDALLAARTRVT